MILSSTFTCFLYLAFHSKLVYAPYLAIADPQGHHLLTFNLLYQVGLDNKPIFPSQNLESIFSLRIIILASGCLSFVGNNFDFLSIV